MANHLIFHDCTDDVKQGIEAYWEQKGPRFERLLQHFPDDQRHMRLSVRRYARRYEAHVTLRLPTGTLVAQADGRDYLEALDIVTDRLAGELRRHRQVIRHDYVHRRRRPRPVAPAVSVLPLERHRRAEDRATFLEQLGPILRTLRDHAHHELVVAQLQDRIAPGTLTVSGLLDEVAARAWERFDDRPADWPLNRWLVELLHATVDEREPASDAAVSLDERLPMDDPRYEADTGWVVENEPGWVEPVTRTLDEEIPSEKTPEPWQEMAAAEERRWFLAQLHRLPHRQRRAFALYAFEGWDEDDIGMLQHRPVAAVRADIENARAALREQVERLDEPETVARSDSPPLG